MFPPDLFPKLTPGTYAITSPAAESHNCIAFALGDETRWWWPAQGPAVLGGPMYHWPSECPFDDSVAAFDCALASVGFHCAKKRRWATVEIGVPKVAIYAMSGRVKHAARQWSNGRWRSKMGAAHDIEHELRAVEGPLYGTVIAVYERRGKSAVARLYERLRSLGKPFLAVREY